MPDPRAGEGEAMREAVPVPLRCPNGHLWEAWLDAVASYGTVFRPKVCPICGEPGQVKSEPVKEKP